MKTAIKFSMQTGLETLKLALVNFDNIPTPKKDCGYFISDTDSHLLVILVNYNGWAEGYVFNKTDHAMDFPLGMWLAEHEVYQTWIDTSAVCIWE